jgi:arylsulfatase A
MVLTHTPFTHAPKNRGAALKGAALHPGMVDYVDYDVGRFLAALDRLKLRDKTVVFFTTDNGTVPGVRCRVNGRMVNGGKGTLRETGIRVPLIVSWLGHLERGRRETALIDFSDFFPTIIALARASAPAGVTIDGRSFAPLLRGDPSFKPREWS